MFLQATNKLSLYPEFSQLRKTVAALQQENFKALVQEENAQAYLSQLAARSGNVQKAVSLLTEIVVEEFTALRGQMAERDRAMAALQAKNEELERRGTNPAPVLSLTTRFVQEAPSHNRYCQDLKTWAAAAHEDLVELRQAVAVEVTEDSLALRRIAGQHTDLIESLRQQQGVLQKVGPRDRWCSARVHGNLERCRTLQDLTALARSHEEGQGLLLDLKTRFEARVRGLGEATELTVMDMRHRLSTLEGQMAEISSKNAQLEDLLYR